MKRFLPALVSTLVSTPLHAQETTALPPARPLWMWEEAILRGFEVFRDLRRNRGGIVTADMMRHRLTFRPIK